jgi:hypothetical protein
MVRANPTWGEERIAHELWLKLGIRVSPRTVRAYWPLEDPWSDRRSQNWSTFVRNHARALQACDFMVAVTARFQTIYVFVAMEIGSRRILHCNVTSHPTGQWTIQQLRDVIAVLAVPCAVDPVNPVCLGVALYQLANSVYDFLYNLFGWGPPNSKAACCRGPLTSEGSERPRSAYQMRT